LSTPTGDYHSTTILTSVVSTFLDGKVIWWGTVLNLAFASTVVDTSLYPYVFKALTLT